MDLGENRAYKKTKGKPNFQTEREEQIVKNVDYLVVLSGIAVGIAALILTLFGNPANMGFCIACFERDIAGAIGLHSAKVVQYVRPEIIGIVLGSFLVSVLSREFKVKSGSAPVTRFILGAVVMIGALVFLGCPLRMVIRLGGGDGTALSGLFGFITGAAIGVFFLKKGCSLPRAYEGKAQEGALTTFLLLGLLILSLYAPTLFKMSTKGPGSMHAPVMIAFGTAVIVGILAQKSRLCMVGGIRDMFLFGDLKLLYGFIAVFFTILAGNLYLGTFKFAFNGQPIAHSNMLWNFLGMVVVGWGSVLLGGCPLRQLILAGTGNSDSGITVLGMITGAAISHNFLLAAGPDLIKNGVLKVGGIGHNGEIALAICVAVLFYTSLSNMPKEDK